MVTKAIGEMFEEIGNLPTEKDRVDFLKKNAGDTGLLASIQLACDSRVVFDLPEGLPPFKDEGLKEGITDSNLRQSISKMYLFIKDHHLSKTLTQVRREQLFQNLIESIGPKDRKALSQIKDRKVPWLTKSLLEGASIKAMDNVLEHFVEQVVDSPRQGETKPKKNTIKRKPRKEQHGKVTD